MADAEDRMMIGIEYTGSQAIQRFGKDLEILPREITEVVNQMASAGGDTTLLRRKGQDIGRAFMAGIRLETASAQGLLNVAGMGSSFGRTVAQSSGIPERYTRQFAEVERMANLTRARMIAANAPITTGQSYLTGLQRSLQSSEQQATRSARAFGLMRGEQEKLNRTPTTLQRDVQAVQRAPVSQATRDILARRLAEPQLLSAAPLSMAPRYAPSVRTQLYGPQQATGPYSDYVREQQDRARQTPIRRIEMARSLGMGQSVQSVATEFNAGLPEIKRVSSTYRELIDSVRQQILSTKGLTREQQVAAAQLVAQSKVPFTGGQGAGWVGRSLSGAPPLGETPDEAYRRIAATARQQRVERADLSAGRYNVNPTATPFEKYQSLSDWRQGRLEQSDLQQMRNQILGPQRIMARLPEADVRWNNAGGRGAGGFRDSFAAGFSGPQGGSTGEMIGQTARIALFYGVAYRALATLQQGIAAAVKETMAYEDALTNLNVVTGRTRASNEGLATTLADIAVSAGFAPSSGIELGSKALGLYGVIQADSATQDRTIELSSQVATRVARVAGGDPMATQTQLAGAMRSLGWGIERLPELEDTISFISNRTGQASTELLGAVANIATLGTQSGFTPQQLAALVAQVGTTTGQNPEATAGQFRQLLSRSAPEIAAKGSEIVGTDLTGMNLQEIFAAVSQMTLTNDQLNAFASLFGKGGSQQVATILTQQYGTVQQLATDSQNAQGFGQDRYDAMMTSVGNRIKEFGATFAQFGVQLIETGILDWIAAVLVATQQVVEVGTGVLELFNALPRPMRAVALALAEVYAAALLTTKLGIGGRAGALAAQVVSLAPGLGRGGLLAAPAFAQKAIIENRSFARGLQGPLLASGAFVSGAPVAGNTLRDLLNTPLGPTSGRHVEARTLADGVRDGFSRGWGSLFGAKRLTPDARANLPGGFIGGAQRVTGLTGAGLGVAGLALVVAATAGAAIDADMRNRQLATDAQTASAAARTAEDMRDAAGLAFNAAQAMRASTLEGLGTGDVINLLPSAINSLTQGGNIVEADRLQKFNTERATALEEARLSSTVADRAFGGDFSAEGLATGVQALADEGYSATQQLDILNEALARLATGSAQAADAVAVIAPEQQAYAVGQLQSGVISAIETTRGNAAARLLAENENAKYLGFGVGYPAQRANSDVGRFEADRNALTLSEGEMSSLNAALGEALTGQVSMLASDGIIDDADLAEIIKSAQDTVGGSVDLSGRSQAVRDELNVWIATNVRRALEPFSMKAISADPQAYFDIVRAGAAQTASETEGLTGRRDPSEELRALLTARGIAILAMNADGVFSQSDAKALRGIDIDIASAQRALVTQRLESIQNLAKFQQGQLTDDDVLGRLAIEAQSLSEQEQIARGTLAEDQNRAYSQARSGQVPNPVSTSNLRDIVTQKASLARAQAAEQAAIAQYSATAYISPGNEIGMAAAQITASRNALGLLKKGSSAWWQAQGQLTQAQYAYTSTVIQAQNANALAAVDPRNDLGRISTQIANAKREMSQLPANQRGALRDQVNQLNIQYAQAVVAQANALATANIAGNRSELAQAQVALGNAQRTLSTQLGGTEGYYSALGALREAQAALGQAERSQADRLLRLGSDLTDPVEQARLDVQRAREQLFADQASGQGSDVIGQDQLDLRSSQNSAEAAAFNQHISDLQTAEDLGRISQSAYISYLQSEHDRLASIADRTRQQQEQLDQVDKLMKSAAEQLQGQFNIGDIQLPTIYEVRRALQSGAPTSVADYSHSNNIVNINGAPLDQVIEYLQNYLGAGAQVVTATTGRKL